MKRRILIAVFAAMVLVIGSSLIVLLNYRGPSNATVNYTYEVVTVYPHDKNAFTEGLVIENGVMYESTGLYGNSTLRRVELESGKILQVYVLSDQFFGEGITIFGGTIIQLTWQNHAGFVYDKHSLGLLRNFSYHTEGWGLTNNGTALIMSDGTANLYFLDTETFERIGQIEVHDTGPISSLNELEYIRGQIYANIWMEDRIAVINPQTGQVTAWIDLRGLGSQDSQDMENVLNGIAYDAEGDRLFVTGKMWSQLFQIKLIPLK